MKTDSFVKHQAMDPNEIRSTRIAKLKQLKRLARFVLDQNKLLGQSKKPNWQVQVNEKNISQLKQIITELRQDLHDRKLAEFVNQEIKSHTFLKSTDHLLATPALFELVGNVEYDRIRFRILRLSPMYSIAYDLYWIMDGTVGEHWQLALGEAKPEILEKYCDSKLEEIQTNIVPYLQSLQVHEHASTLLKELTENFELQSHLASNVLLITIAESLVRELCRFVYAHQNPQLTSSEVEDYVNSFLSIETLLLKGNWQEDIEINLIDAYLMADHISDPVIDEVVERVEQSKRAKEDILKNTRSILKLLEEFGKSKPEDHPELNQIERQQVAHLIDQSQELIPKLVDFGKDKTMISLKLRLQFLLRRFKEDRNSMVHGDFHNFDKKWKSYIYLSAITKITKTIRFYQELYANKPEEES